MKKRDINKQVDARVAAVLILGALAAVQYFWWQGLITRPKVNGGKQGPAGGRPPNEFYVAGLPDARVVTLAGRPEPGDTDGLGRKARFDGPAGLALDTAGNLYVADSRNHRVRRVAPDGKTTTVAGGDAGFGDGDARQARFNTPTGVAVGPDGTVYVADTNNHRIRAIKDGKVTTLAGGEAGFADGPAASARFNTPCGLAIAPGDRLLVADTLNKRIRAIALANPAHPVTTLQATPGSPTSVAASEKLVLAALPDTATVVGVTPSTGLTVDRREMASLIKPERMALKHPVAVYATKEGVFAVDSGHGAVFRLRNGQAEVIAGSVKADGTMHEYRDESGQRSAFGIPGAVIGDGNGHLFVSDGTNNAIRRITLPANL